MVFNLMIRSAGTVLSRRFLEAGFLLVVLMSSAAAQTRTSTDGTTPLGIAPGSPAGSFALSGFDTINPYNGNLNFALPLLKIGGRGSAGYTMTLAVDQRWTVRHQLIDQSYFQHYPGSAWWRPSAGYSPGLLVGRTVGEGSCVSGGGVMSASLTRLTFATPDGTEIELIDKLGGGNVNSIYCYGGGTGPSRGNVFVTMDGSATTFVSDAPIYDIITTQYTFYPSGYLLFKDGTRYRINHGRVAWIRDGNGNTVTLTYDHPQYGKVIKVTDSLKREVTITYNVSDPQYGSHDQITLKGFAGQPRTIRVAYQPLTETLRADQSIKTYSELFGLYDFGGLQFTTSTVSSVWLPDGRRYRLLYNSYAEVARVELPTGGAFEYDWGASLLNGDPKGIVLVDTVFGEIQQHVPEIYRRVLTKRIYANGGAGNSFETRMTFGQTSGQGTSTSATDMATYDSGGNLLAYQKHYFHGNPIPSFASMLFDYPFWNHGREYQTEQFDILSGSAVLVRRVNNTWLPGPNWQIMAQLTETVNTLTETNLVSRQTFSYDQFNNRTDTFEYEFGSGGAGSLIRHSHTDFLVVNPVNGIDYTRDDVGVHQRNLPAQQQIFDGVGAEKSRTTYEYDKYYGDEFHAALVDRPNISGHDAAFTTGYTARGNVTAVTSYLLGTPTTGITAYSQYDVAGNRVKSIDARSTSNNIIARTFDFSDRFGGPDGEARGNTPPAELAGQSSFGFASKVTNALGHEAFTQTDYYLGLTVDAEDINGTVASSYFNDSLDRPTQVRQALATPAATQTTFIYDDANRTITKTTDLHSYTDNLLKSQTVYDGLGRTIETRQFEDSSNFIAVRKVPFVSLLDGGNWRSATQFSNPFRPYLSEQPAWTSTMSDALGRAVRTTTPDSAVVRTAYSGNRTLAADQTGKKRISKTDALGRLTDVWEVTAADGATEAVSFPGFGDVVAGYRTSYAYDMLDNLVTVSQGSQTRTFIFNSLGRLILTTTPESGTTCYGQVLSGQCQGDGYDANGNLTTKTDARGVVATAVYDQLNRITSRAYLNDPSGTPAVTYTYDGATIPNGKGKFASITSSISSYNYISYDAMGRALGRSQTMGGQAYTMIYTYDAAGHTKTMTYPSGHSVTYNYDNSGRLADKDAQNLAFTGTLGDGTTRTYSRGISYAAFGGMSQEQFGTATAIFNKRFYNSRGQLAEIRAGLTANDTSWQRGTIINHYSDTCWGMCAGLPMTDNNGSLKKQEHWIQDANGSVAAILTQRYEYDSLNRLQRVFEGDPNSPAWQQSYSYDRYGNRTINTGATSGTGINNTAFEVDPSGTNRLLAPGDTGLPENSRRMQYDQAGNLKFDNYTGQGTRTYDAENRVIQAWGNGQWQTYGYDGDGRRARRIVNGVEIWQVYGNGGELLAEYAANAAPSSPQKEYGYRNGELLVTAAGGSTGWGPPPSYTGPNPLATGHQIKLENLTELRTAVNQLRQHAGLSAYTFTVDPNPQPNVTTPKADHIRQLRTALEGARAALGLSTGGYAHPTLTENSSLIYAIEFQELRDQIASAWNTGGGVNIRWMVTDQLGTPRIVCDLSGSLASVSRHDYLPFGEELFAGTGGRTTGLGYTNNDGTRQKFTGKERDTETGLDYFLARYYASTQGRFISPDPVVFSEQQMITPQAWNLYSYVQNNPLLYLDPTGMKLVKLGQNTDEQIEARKKQIEEEKKKIDADKSKTEDQKKAEKAKLDDEKDSLDLEKKGNKAAAEYLAALDTIGERQGLQVSDFTLSTDSANDFAGDATVRGDPGSGGAMFMIPSTQQIFINTNSRDYQLSLGNLTVHDSKGNAVPRSDIIRYMGTAAVHERTHRDSPTRATQYSEGRAYTEQLRVLQKFGPNGFQNKEFFYFAAGHVMNGSEWP